MAIYNTHPGNQFANPASLTPVIAPATAAVWRSLKPVKRLIFVLLLLILFMSIKDDGNTDGDKDIIRNNSN